MTQVAWKVQPPAWFLWEEFHPSWLQNSNIEIQSHPWNLAPKKHLLDHLPAVHFLRCSHLRSQSTLDTERFRTFLFRTLLSHSTSIHQCRSHNVTIPKFDELQQFWDKTLAFLFACLVWVVGGHHSTHRHAAWKPRLRKWPCLGDEHPIYGWFAKDGPPISNLGLSGIIWDYLAPSCRGFFKNFPQPSAPQCFCWAMD